MQLVINELWLHILGELEYKQIVQCRAVCSYWKMMIDTSLSLVYKVWLGIHAKTDRPWASHHMPVAERLTHLLLTEEIGWRTLTFPRRELFPLSRAQLRIMGFGGTCERASHSVGDLGFLTLGALPSASSTQPFGFREPIVFECSTADYTQDPTLDVLVFFSSAAGVPPAFSLRSLSDPSKPHSFSAATVLDTRGLVPDDGRSWTFSKTALVSDKFVLKADSHDLSVLLIWNWIHGNLLVRKEMPLPPFICGGVSLISNNTFILPIIALSDNLQIHNPAAYIEVYEFDDHGSSCASVPQHSQFASDAYACPRHVRTFLLPEMKIPSPCDDHAELSFDFYCFSLFHNSLSLAAENIPGFNPSKSGSAMLIGDLDRPTQALDKDRLCHLILEAQLGEADMRHSYDFFVYTSTFLEHPPLPKLDALSERIFLSLCGPQMVPWKEWGVKNAAAFCSLGGTHEMTDVDICWHARGDRVAAVGIDREWAMKQDEDTLRTGQRNWQLRVLDFRADRVRRVDSTAKAATKTKTSLVPLWPRPPPVFKEDHGAVHHSIKCSSTDKYATPAGYSGEYFFKEWPIRANLSYVETILDRTIKALWIDVEMDGEHLVTNRCEDYEENVVHVEILSM